jgi:hypothetical protein
LKKLQQYKIFKFKSDRLKRRNYKLEIIVADAYLNGEVVSLGESELIRAIYKIKNKYPIEYDLINALQKDKINIKKLENSKENRKKIAEIDEKLEEFLFIKELVNIEFTDTRHYNNIIKQGLFINGKEYVRLLTGAGMARKSTVQFVEKEFSYKLKSILDNNRNTDVELVDSKYNAYFALVSSASYSISTPRFCVVHDYEFTKNRLVDFVVETPEGEGDYVETRMMDIKHNAFDGQGLVSLSMAKRWAHDLDLNYYPNSFCIRGSFLKGQCVAFDFHKFIIENNLSPFIIDVWGNQVDIRNVDVILTESQLKLWNSYDSCDSYTKSCEKNGLGWSVSRYTPKQEKDYFSSSYQLLQVLNLEKEEVEKMAQPTVDWLRNVSSGNVNYALLYLLGVTADQEELDDKWFSYLNNWSYKALLLNHNLFQDSYIKKTIYQTLNKKIKEARMGKLLFPGNWQVCIADPYAFCEYVFGMPEVNGLLEENQHYCEYWNNRDVDTVASGRSPLTWKSEMNILHLQNNEKVKKWFGHIHSGVIFNIHGVDTMLMADSDFDYDICFTTSQPEFIKGAEGGLPVTYDRKLPKKNIIDESKLHEADINTMGSKIGWITNLGTTLYSLLPMFPKDSIEYNEIIKRLIIIRKAQGNEIDRGKGILVKALPKWDQWIPEKPDMTEDEIRQRELHNKLVINRRPKFMIYLYSDYMRKYKNHRDIYQNYCESFYGYNLDTLIHKENRNQYEESIYNKYMEFNPFIESNSIMGYLCDHMEISLNEIKLSLKDGKGFEVSSMINYDIEIDQQKYELMKSLYRKFRYIKEGKYYFNDSNDMIQSKISELRKDAYKDISSDRSELANLAVHFGYIQRSGLSGRDFCWKMFGEEILGNIIDNGYDRAILPLQDKFGNIHYLGKRYSLLSIKINKDNL